MPEGMTQERIDQYRRYAQDCHFDEGAAINRERVIECLAEVERLNAEIAQIHKYWQADVDEKERNAQVLWSFLHPGDTKGWEYSAQPTEEAIREIERLRTLPAWRPASEVPTERRPEDDELSPRYPLLVETRGGETLLGIGFYGDLGKSWHVCFPDARKVTHWLPTPSPPHEER